MQVSCSTAKLHCLCKKYRESVHEDVTICAAGRSSLRGGVQQRSGWIFSISIPNNVGQFCALYFCRLGCVKEGLIGLEGTVNLTTEKQFLQLKYLEDKQMCG